MQSELEELAARLATRGYRYRSAPYFADSGVMIYLPPTPGELAAVEHRVFVYPRGQRWEARVTEHGGPHWVREIDVTQLEEAALEGLRSAVRPPTSEWKVDG